MDQISIFDFIDEDECLTEDERIFRSVIDRGSVVAGSLDRIKAKIDLPFGEFVDFLKNEFGIGGWGYTGHNALWDGKGLRCGSDLKHMKLYSWQTVANAYKTKFR